MPKTKNQRKTNKILNWFKPASPAKGMLLFALAFAFMGGSYMAYKSFAANSVVNGSDKITCVKDCYRADENTGKGKITVWVVIPPQGLLETTFRNNTSFSKVCFTAKKATTQTGVVIFQAFDPTTLRGPNKVFNIDSTSYEKRCLTWSSAFGGGSTIIARLYARGDGANSNIVVANISVE